MTAFSFDIVGFDLDGTLVDTAADLAAAVNHALRSDGRPTLSVAQVRGIVGGGARHMFGQALALTGGGGDAAVDRLLPRLRNHYAAHIAGESRPYPGCFDALDALAARGVTLAVATNKDEALAVHLLDALGLAGRFATVIGGDTLGPGRGKPARDMLDLMVARCGGGRAAFVGDSRYDVMAARAAAMPVVACSFGFTHDAAELRGADAVIDGYDELVPALDRLGAGR